MLQKYNHKVEDVLFERDVLRVRSYLAASRLPAACTSLKTARE